MTGYIVVDGTGIDLLSDKKVTVDGIYNQVKEAYETNKPVIVENCEYGTGVHASPISIMVIEEDGSFIGTNSILQVIVDSDDGVTISSLITSNSKSTKASK